MLAADDPRRCADTDAREPPNRSRHSARVSVTPDGAGVACKAGRIGYRFSIVRGYGRVCVEGMRAVLSALPLAGAVMYVRSLYYVYPLHDPVDPSGGVGSTHRAYAHIGETAARTPPPPDDRGLRGPGAVDSDWAFLR